MNLLFRGRWGGKNRWRELRHEGACHGAAKQKGPMMEYISERTKNSVVGHRFDDKKEVICAPSPASKLEEMDISMMAELVSRCPSCLRNTRYVSGKDVISSRQYHTRPDRDRSLILRFLSTDRQYLNVRLRR